MYWRAPRGGLGISYAAALNRSGPGLFPLYFYAITPKPIQVIELAGCLAEDVDDDIDKVDAGPVCVAIANVRKRAEVARAGHLVQVLAGGLHLPGAGAGGDHQEIGHRRDLAHVQNDNVVAARIGKQFGRVNSELPGSCQLLRRLGLGLCCRDDSPPGQSSQKGGPIAAIIPL